MPTATTTSSSPGSLYVCFRDGLDKVLFSPPHSRTRFLFSLASAQPTGSPIPHNPLSVSAHRRAGSNRFCSCAAVELFIRESGVEVPSSLTPQDAALVDATPDLHYKRFAALFGGNVEHERPYSHERNIVCINPVAQPYAPRSPGESGLLFFAPGVVRFEDNYPSFHVFVNMSPPKTQARERRYRYFGTYAKVPIIRTTVEVDEWLGLPIRVSRSLTFSCTRQMVFAKVIRLTPHFVCTSAVLRGHGASSPTHRPACVPCTREWAYARCVRRVPRHRQMRSMRG